MILRRLRKARIFLGRLEIWLVEIYETGHSRSGCWLNRLVRNLNYNGSTDLKGSTLFYRIYCIHNVNLSACRVFLKA